MEKWIVRHLVLFLFLNVAVSYCKAEDDNPMEIGLKFGFNISNLYTTDSSTSDISMGMNTGAFIKMPISTTLAIQPELCLTVKGSTIRFNSANLDGTVRFELTYLEIPVLLVLKSTKHLNFQVGPYLSYLMNANVRNVRDIHLFDYEQNLNLYQFRRFDTGLIIGAALVVHSITVNVRYSYGFIKVGKEQVISGNSYTIPNTNNGVLSVHMSIPIYFREYRRNTNQKY